MCLRAGRAPPLRMGLCSAQNRYGSGGNDVPRAGYIRPLQIRGRLRALRNRGGRAMCRGPDSPQGCPAIRPLRIRGSSWPSRNRAARQCSCGRGVPRPYEWGTVRGHHGTERPGNVPAGGACPAPTNGGPFADITEQSGQAMFLRAGRAPPLRTGDRLRPSRDGG